MQTLEIQELVERSRVARRTIYFYVQQGLLPPPSGAGLGARYSEEHLLRLQMIPLLRRNHLRLDEIRERLAKMSAAEMQAALNGAASVPPLQAELPAFAPLGAACLRYDLPGGVVLLVPQTLPARQRALVEQILAAAAQAQD